MLTKEAEEILYNSPVTYILEGKIPKQERNFIEWAKWMETANRHVNKTELPGDICISTVFLGTNHNYLFGEPLLFETMIFGGEYDGYQERYSTWDEAEAGHQIAIEMIYK